MFNGDSTSLLGPAAAVTQSRRVVGVELIVFLLLIVPSLVLSLFVVQQGNMPFVITALATIFRDVALVALILYFLWRNGEPLARIGWIGRRAWLEVVLGLLLFPPFFFGTVGLDWVLLRLGLTEPSKSLPPALHAQGGGELALAVIMVIVVAIAEETVFRGYLLLRFRRFMGVVAAVVVASAIFAVGHGYEGSAGVVTVGVMGAAFAIIYLWRGSLVAPMVMHFLQDFLGIVLLPMLNLK